ncbi:MAG: type II toxin-antitoxin system HicB family antitoxin [Bacteroidetes bacterium]|nr:type II toxin-antitoxin system HicB family antitoxin [Bacteroidota bacterium]
MLRRLNVIVEKDINGYYAYCPELEGCHTQGETFDEVMKNIKEAIELYVETLNEEEKKELQTKEIITTSYEVSLA